MYIVGMGGVFHHGPWGAQAVPGELSGDPRGPSGGRWGVSGVAGRVPGAFQCEAELVEKPVVFVVFPAFGGARGDIDSKRELLDVARRSLLGVPGCLWRFLGGPGGVRGESLGSRGAPLVAESPLGRPP